MFLINFQGFEYISDYCGMHHDRNRVDFQLSLSTMLIAAGLLSQYSIYTLYQHISQRRLNFRCAIDFDDGRTLLAFFEFFKIFGAGFSGNPGIFRKILVFCISEKI